MKKVNSHLKKENPGRKWGKPTGKRKNGRIPKGQKTGEKGKKGGELKTAKWQKREKRNVFHGKPCSQPAGAT